MELFTFYLIVMAVTSVVLLVLYSVITVHALRGSKFKLLLLLLGLLLSYNISLAAFTYAAYMFIEQNQ